MRLQLALETLEERHRVGRRARKAADHALLELADLSRVRLDDLRALRDLAVADEELQNSERGEVA